MTPPMRWLAVLAAGGAVAGGAAALGHASAAASTGVARTSTVARPTAGVPNKSAAEIRLLISETNLLQGKLALAREELARVVAHPARTLIYKRVLVPGAPSASSSALAGQIASEQAALAAERAQLQGEQAQLGGEAQALAQRQGQLVKEAAALTAEAKKLAAASHRGSQGGGHDD